MAGTPYAKRYAGGFADLPSQTTAIDSTFLNAVETALLQLLAVVPNADGQVPVWVDASTRFGFAKILDANISSSAAITWSKIASTGAIKDADIASNAAIAASKISGALAPSSNGTLASRPTASTVANQFYWATDVGTLYLSNGSTWIRLSVPSGSLGAIPAKTAAPTGWVVADGTSYLRATYTELYGALVQSMSTVTVTIASPGVFTSVAHGLKQGDIVFFETTGALPTGLSADTPYYVISTGLATDTFRVSATHWTYASGVSASSSGAITDGSVVNTSGSQSGTHTMYYAPYSVADSTHFYVPDHRGRVRVGLSSGGRVMVGSVAMHDNRTQANRDISHFHNYTFSGGSAVSSKGNSISAGDTNATSGDSANQDYPAFAVANPIIKL